MQISLFLSHKLPNHYLLDHYYVTGFVIGLYSDYCTKEIYITDRVFIMLVDRDYVTGFVVGLYSDSWTY